MFATSSAGMHRSIPMRTFAETFAAWLTADMDWRTEYAGWPALRKLEWLDELMRAIAARTIDYGR